MKKQTMGACYAAVGAAMMLTLAGALIGGCASAAHRAEARAALAASEQRGQELFANNCDRCHPGGEKLIGPSLNHWYVTAFVIRYKVRHGGGGMPSFPESAISAEQLPDLVAHVKSLRRSPAEPAA